MVYFVVVYRRRPGGPKIRQISHNTPLEVTWSVIPLILVAVIFLWGFRGFMDMHIAPRNAMEVHVTGKKWLWAFEHTSGRKESAELHVPVNTPVRLIMSSDDVIHSFFVPNFRIKQDVVPGRYTTLWFQATQLGEHHVFCTEYCGKDHSVMAAKVVVMTPEEFKTWSDKDPDEGMPLAELGAKMYQKNACVSCHSIDGSAVIGPTFKGLFGRSEQLTGGGTVVVDEQYLRESILEPQAKIVQGYQPVMPTYKGTLTERQLNGVIEYIKTIK